MNELKPCPFCGSKPKLFVDNYGQYGAMCEGCGMYLGVELECGVALHDGWKATFDTLESASGAWNRRAWNDENS